MVNTVLAVTHNNRVWLFNNFVNFGTQLQTFTKSLGKEIGRKGATANLLEVAPGAESSVAGALRFFLSGHSAFISGQPLALSLPAGLPESLAPIVAVLRGQQIAAGFEK